MFSLIVFKVRSQLGDSELGMDAFSPHPRLIANKTGERLGLAFIVMQLCHSQPDRRNPATSDLRDTPYIGPECGNNGKSLVALGSLG